MPRRRGLRLRTLTDFGGEWYSVRVRSSCSWKGRGTQEGAGERERVTLEEETMLFREGRRDLIAE